ncbi:MAG: GNAT family N-acetyltransferase [bacterium]|nr:GNAT family N-acetyltransferase [bacterium]
MNSTEIGPEIRLATPNDLPEIATIFNHYIAHSTCTFYLEPHSEEYYTTWLKDRSPAHPVTVAERDGQVTGWAALSPWKPRQAYKHTVEGSVYLLPDARQKGIGSALLNDLIKRARTLGHRTLIGGACTEHPGSLALQKKFGFKEVGCLKEVGYKFDRWLDVMILQLTL